LNLSRIEPVSVCQARGKTINIFADDRGIARFLLDALPADERQHVIDVVNAQRDEDLRRLRAQSLPKPRPDTTDAPADVIDEELDPVA
jgi:hypothetical protein